MEGESRKRKHENNEEESEEEKMEKFFALVRSTKDVRDRLSNSKKKEDKKDDEEKEKGSWKPRFEPEDFMDFQGLGMGWSTHNLSNPSHASSSSSAANPKQVETEPPPQNEDKYGKASDHLDLTLSL